MTNVQLIKHIPLGLQHMLVVFSRHVVALPRRALSPWLQLANLSLIRIRGFVITQSFAVGLFKTHNRLMWVPLYCHNSKDYRSLFKAKPIMQVSISEKKKKKENREPPLCCISCIASSVVGVALFS